MTRRLHAGLLALFLSSSGNAAEPGTAVTCHIDYGGRIQQIAARPTSDPYTEAAHPVGSHLRFRIVFRREPADLAGIKLYTYADNDGQPALVHQASYPYPVANAAVDGFTGRQSVYEPALNAELQYWCELQNGPAK